MERAGESAKPIHGGELLVRAGITSSPGWCIGVWDIRRPDSKQCHSLRLIRDRTAFAGLPTERISIRVSYPILYLKSH